MGASTKKRDASSYPAPASGSPNKKRRSAPEDKNIASKATKGKEKSVAKTPPFSKLSSKSSALPPTAQPKAKAQRKVPVTSAATMGETSGSESDLDVGEGEDVEMEDEGDVMGDEGDFEGVEEEEAEFEDGEKEKNGQQHEKTSAREAHKAQKELLVTRRASKQHASVLSKAKSLWAAARRKDAPKSERSQAISDLHAAVRGHIQDICLKHDASRIVQTLVKHGSPAVRDEVAKELEGKYKELAQNKYSKFLVTKLVRLCPQRRAAIIGEFRGHVVRLLLHREAGNVLADAFELYANAFERALLTFEFFGREVALFTPELAKGANTSDEEREKLKKGLAGVLEGADEERRKRILKDVKENLELVMNNPDKGAMSHAIFHRVLWEYLSQLNELKDEVLREKLRHEIFEACQEQLADMVHTRDGSRVVRELIVQGTAKDRKQIVKVLKPHVERIAKDDDAQTVLFTALDVIDDTKLLDKSLVAPLTTPSVARTLYVSAAGRRSLLYLLVPRSSRHFTPALSSLLAETDATRQRTSKKDAETRQREVLEAASPGLIRLLEGEGDGGVEEMLRDPGGSLVVTEVALVAEGDKSKAIKSLTDLLARPYPSTPTDPQHIIDIPHASRVYKTLLQGGHFSRSTGAVARPSTSSESSTVFRPIAFTRQWLETVDAETTRALGLGGGAFVVAALVEAVKKDGADADRRMLREHLDAKYAKTVEESDVKGRKVLVDALSEL